MRLKISQDGRDVLCCVVRGPQQQGEDLHGFRLDAKGDRAGRPRSDLPGQCDQVRSGGLAADGRGDPHAGRPLHPDNRPARRRLHTRPRPQAAGQRIGAKQM